MICLALHWRISSLFASEYLTSSISCLQGARALKLFLLSLTRFYVRARTQVLLELLALRCLVRWGPLNPPPRQNPRYNESNHPDEDDVISYDEKTPEEITAAELRANRRRGYDPIHHSMQNITSFLSGVGSSVSSTPSLERELLRRRRFSLNLIRMILVRLSRLCTERANPLLQQSSFTKTLVERWYSSVLLI